MADSATTQEQLAALTGLTQQRISQLQRQGVIKRGENPVVANRKIIAHQGAQAAGWSSKNGMLDRIQEAAMLDRVRREEIEIKVAKLKGDLIPLDAIGASLQFLIGSVRAKLLALPARIRSIMPQMTPKQVDSLDAIIRECLTELASANFPRPVDELAQSYFKTLHAAAEADGKRVGRQKSDVKPRKQRRAG